MNLYLKIILVLLGLAYLISPVDLIPDLLLPYVGWLDDLTVLWAIWHLIRYNRLPPLFRFRSRPPKKPQAPKTSSRTGPSRKTRPRPTDPPAPGTGAGQKKSPHEILGVDPQASWDTIHAAYKQKAKQYHPDKLSHLGEEFSLLASKKFLEIQTAYETLKSKR